MTITYDQEIWKSQRVTAHGANPEEFDLVESHLDGLGYERKHKPKDLTKPWEAYYIRSEVLATTSRGDLITLDGRYKLAEGTKT